MRFASVVSGGLILACSSSSGEERVAIDTASYCRRVVEECKEATTVPECQRALSPVRVTRECAARIEGASCAEIADSAALEAFCSPPCTTPGSLSCNYDGTILDGTITGCSARGRTVVWDCGAICEAAHGRPYTGTCGKQFGDQTSAQDKCWCRE